MMLVSSSSMRQLLLKCSKSDLTSRLPYVARLERSWGTCLGSEALNVDSFVVLVGSTSKIQLSWLCMF